MSHDSTGRGLGSCRFKRIFILSPYGEQGKDRGGGEIKGQAACQPPPSSSWAYRVKEGSLFFVDELH